MIYALNVFNIVPGQEAVYADYSVKAGKIIYGLGGRVVCSGYQPIQNLKSDVQRSQFIVVAFPSRDIFDQFHAEAESQDIHRLREGATTDYIWTLFEPWALREWVNQF